MTSKTLTIATHEEHMEARKASIGSSDIPSILGLNKWATPRDVWLKKTGRIKDDQGNKFTKAGHYLEPVVARYFTDETSYVIEKESEQITVLFYSEHDFFSASPDRYFYKEGKRGILECKTTQKQVDKEDFPLYWFSQLQWQLGIAGLEFGAVAWLERGVDFDYMEFEFDPEYFAFMVDIAYDFWMTHVVADVEPDPVRAQDVVNAYPDHLKGKKLTASREMAQAVTELSDIKEQISALKEKEQAIKETIQLAMRDAEAIEYAGETLVTWKKAKDSLRFDEKAFREEHPDLYQQFTFIKPGSRRFLVK